MPMELTRLNEEMEACTKCDRAERCQFYQAYKVQGLIRFWSQGKLLRLCR